jgi:hypothetical protein
MQRVDSKPHTTHACPTAASTHRLKWPDTLTTWWSSGQSSIAACTGGPTSTSVYSVTAAQMQRGCSGFDGDAMSSMRLRSQRLYDAARLRFATSTYRYALVSDGQPSKTQRSRAAWWSASRAASAGVFCEAV